MLIVGFSVDSFIFLFLSMILIAASLYLPEHIATVFRRAFFYYYGDDGLVDSPDMKESISPNGMNLVDLK